MLGFDPTKLTDDRRMPSDDAGATGDTRTRLSPRGRQRYTALGRIGGLVVGCRATGPGGQAARELGRARGAAGPAARAVRSSGQRAISPSGLHTKLKSQKVFYSEAFLMILV